jgi:hypothetical protein
LRNKKKKKVEEKDDIAVMLMEILFTWAAAQKKVRFIRCFE